MKSGYCIYTNQIVGDLTPEHIIPLALGGSNQFCVEVDRSCNSHLGSGIDGKMANSFLIQEIRAKKQYKGHSGKDIHAIAKNSILDGQSVQAHFPSGLTTGADEITGKVYSHKEKRYLKNHEIGGKTLQVKFTIDMKLELAFVAKVLLAAGYFIYKNDFIKYADHDQLRKHVNWYMRGADLADNPYNHVLNGEVGCLHRLTLIKEIEDAAKDGKVPEPHIFSVLAGICEFVEDSCVIIRIKETQFMGTVGIGGYYIGTIIVDANGKKLVEQSGNDWVLSVVDKKLKKESLNIVAQALEANRNK